MLNYNELQNIITDQFSYSNFKLNRENNDLPSTERSFQMVFIGFFAMMKRSGSNDCFYSLLGCILRNNFFNTKPYN